MQKKLISLSIILAFFFTMLTGCYNDNTKAMVTTKSVDKSVYMDATRDVGERVEALMSQMTLEEKVGQMLQAEQTEPRGGASPEDAQEYVIGAMLFSGGAIPPTGNMPNDWKDRAELYETAALNTRLGIPLLFGVDAIHGHNNVYGATIYPHSIGIGAAANTELTRQLGAAAAEEIRATGTQMTFSPTLGLPQNERWGRYYECFAEDAELAGALGAAYIEGYQGIEGEDDFLSSSHVLATAKHYIAEGMTKNGKNQGNVEVDESAFNQILYDELLVPYRDAIEAGVRCVMVSYHSINDEGVHANKELITDILKVELGFEGIVVSDYNAITKLLTPDDSYKDKLKLAVTAGIDLFMEPHNWDEFLSTMTELVEEDSVSMERIDDAVSRILTVKFEMGLFEEPFSDDSLMETIGSNEHRELARQAVRESMTLLKNDTISDSSKTVMEMLSEYNNILVAGTAAHDIGIQCGGWSITWQGSTGETTEGTTILEGIREAVGDTKNVTYSENGTVLNTHEVAIVVVGERPYSESKGDRQPGELVLPENDQAVIANIRESNPNIPIVCILITGRPITIANELGDMDALICAWLPGTEGAGVADILFGDYEFTGTSPVTWPWYALDVTEKFTDESKVLFPLGMGLKRDGTSIKKGGQAVIGEAPQEPYDDTIIRFDDEGGSFEAEGIYGQFETVTEYKEGASEGACLGGIYGASEAWYKIDVAKAGTYQIEMCIAVGRDDPWQGILKLYIDEDEEGLSPDLSYTGGWGEKESDWKIVTITSYLTKGEQIFKIEANSWGFNIDKFTFTRIAD